jgi:hypothetical protein
MEPLTLELFLQKCSYAELQTMAMDLNDVLELVNKIQPVGIKRVDLEAAITKVVEDNVDTLLELTDGPEQVTRLVYLLKTLNETEEYEPETVVVDDASIDYTEDEITEADTQEETKESENVEEPTPATAPNGDESTSPETATSSKKAAKMSEAAVHVKRRLNEYVIRSSGDNAWPVPKRTKRFVELFMYLMRHPEREAMQLMLDFMTAKQNRVISETLFHSYTTHQIIDRRARQRVEIFFTSMLHLAKSIRQKRPFRMRIDLIRNAIKNEDIVKFIVEKTSK